MARPYATSRQALAVMRSVQPKGRPFGNDAVAVDLPVAGVVVALDMGKVHRFGDARPLVQLAQPVRQVRIVLDSAQVALEMAEVHRIEAHGRGEQAPVGFRQVFPGQITLFAQPPFDPIQLAKQLVECLFIRLLCGGEARAVYAIVDGRVDPRVERIDLAA